MSDMATLIGAVKKHIETTRPTGEWRDDQEEQLGHQRIERGGPMVVLTILAGDIITITFVLLWLFRWR